MKVKLAFIAELLSTAHVNRVQLVMFAASHFSNTTFPSLIP
jgi:hypothetical protein